MTEYSNKIIAIVGTKANTLSHMQKFLNPEVHLHIYKTTILPTIEYSNQAHSLIPFTYRNKLQKLQNHALKTIIYSHLGDMSIKINDLHIMAKLPSLK